MTNAPAPPPALVASAEGELDDEIPEATPEEQAFLMSELAVRATEYGYRIRDLEARLTAAKSETVRMRQGADEMWASLNSAGAAMLDARAERNAALARAERLEEALREDAQWHESEANRLDCLPQNDFVRWQSSVHAEQAAKARAALAHPAPAEET